jgi:hypothetical protein
MSGHTPHHTTPHHTTMNPVPVHIKLIQSISRPYEYAIVDGEPQLITPWLTNDAFIKEMYALQFQGTRDDILAIRFDSRPIVNAEFILYIMTTLDVIHRTKKTVLQTIKSVPDIDRILEYLRHNNYEHLSREEKARIHSGDDTFAIEKLTQALQTPTQ